MNFRTESLDFPQKEQRKCLSCDMVVRAIVQARWGAPERTPARQGLANHNDDASERSMGTCLHSHVSRFTMQTS